MAKSPAVKSKPQPVARRNGSSPSAVKQLTGNPNNPRKPWENDAQRAAFVASLKEFGDLSGVVFNLTTKQIVGGHKRVEEFKNDDGVKLEIAERFAAADETGTVAYGYVILSTGVRFAYREVKWAKAKESAANLAANKWGAEWDKNLLQTMLIELKEAEFPLNVTGFNDDDLIKLSEELAPAAAPAGFAAYDENIPVQHVCPKCSYAWSGKPS